MPDDSRLLGAQASDGDTLTGNRRITGGNTPEVPHVVGDDVSFGEPGGQAARKALQESLNSGQVTAEHQGYDAHGRELTKLNHAEYGDVMGELIASGLAEAYQNEFSDPEHRTSEFTNLYRELAGGAEQFRPEWAEFITEAKDERQRTARTRLAQMVQTVGNVEYQGFRNGIIKGALARGTDQTQATLYGFANAVGETAGIDPIAKWGEDGVRRNLIEAAQNPARVGSYEDVDSFVDAGVYALEAVFENSPQVALDAVAALGTGGAALGAKAVLAGIGKQALRKMAPAAVGKAGAIASIYAQSAGETRLGQIEAGVEDEDTALAQTFGVGAAKAGLEYVALSKIFGNMLKGAKGGEVTGLADIGRNTASAGFSAGATEGITELSQTLLDQLSLSTLTEENEFDLTEMIDSTLKGAIFGGSLSGVGTAATSTFRMGQDIRNADLSSAAETQPEPQGDLTAQARQYGSVILAPGQNDADREAVVAELERTHGQAHSKTLANGQTLITADPEELANTPDDITPEDLGRSRYGVAKEDLDPDSLRTVYAEDADGNRLREVLADEQTHEAVAQRLREEAPTAQIGQQSPEAVNQRRRERGSPDLSNLQRQTPTGPAPAEPPTVQAEGPAPIEQFANNPAVAQQDQAAAPVEDGGSESLFQDGQLRPAGELTAALRSGRLNEQELANELQRLGIDPQRALNEARPSFNRERTERAVLGALRQNRTKLKELLGTDGAGKPTWQLANDAAEQLQGLSDSELARFAEQSDLEVRGEVEFVGLGGDRQGNEGGSVERSRNTAINRIVNRVKQQLKADSPALFDVTALAPAFAGANMFTAGTAQGTARLRNHLQGHFNEARLRHHLQSLDDSALISAGESVGTPLANLTREAPAKGENYAGLVRELSARYQPEQGFAPREQAEDTAEPTGPHPYEAARQQLDELFDQDGEARPFNAVREDLGGSAKLARAINRAWKQIHRSNPDLSNTVLGQARQLQPVAEGLSGPEQIDAHTNVRTSELALPRLVELWQQQLGDAARSAARNRNQAFSDAAQLKYRVGLELPTVLSFQHIFPEQLSAAELQEAYQQQHLGQLDGLLAEMGDGRDTTAARDAILTVEPVDSDTMAPYFAQRLTEWSWSNGLGTAPRDIQQASFYRGLSTTLANNPSRPEAAAVAYLTKHGFLGQKDLPPPQELDRSDLSRDAGLAVLRQDASAEEVFFYRVRRATAQLLPQDSADAEDPMAVLDDALSGPMLTDGQREQVWEAVLSKVPLNRISFGESRLGDPSSDPDSLDGAPYGAHDRAVSAELTQRFEGANLLEVRQKIGESERQVFIDAIALADFAKGGRPETAIEAYENLLDNLGRMTLGPQHTDKVTDQYSLPNVPDELVFYVDPLTNEPITVGAARSMATEVQHTEAEVVQALVRQEELRVERAAIEDKVVAAFDAKLAEVERYKDATYKARKRQELLDARKAILGIEADSPDRVISARENRQARREGQPALQTIWTKVSAELVDGSIGTLKDLAAHYRYTLGQMGKVAAIIRRAGELDSSTLGEASLDPETAFDKGYDPSETESQERETEAAKWGNDAPERLESARNTDVGLRSDGTSIDVGTDDGNASGLWGGDSNAQVSQNYLDDDGQTADSREGYIGDTPDELTRSPRRKTSAEIEAEVQAFLAQGGQVTAVGDVPTVSKPIQERGLQRTSQPTAAPRQGSPKVRFLGDISQDSDFRSLVAYAKRLLTTIKADYGVQIDLTTANEQGIGELYRSLDEAGAVPDDSAFVEAITALTQRPGYLNLGDRAVIAMDRPSSAAHRGEWLMSFTHELGHLVYDQSYHNLPQAQKDALQTAFNEVADQYASYGDVAFKEWFADQFAASVARQSSEPLPSTALGTAALAEKGVRKVVTALGNFWNAAKADLNRRDSRWQLSKTFEAFAEEVLAGKVQLAHRYDIEGYQSLHYTPTGARIAPAGLWARAKQTTSSPTFRGLTGPFRMTITRIKQYSPELANLLFQQANTRGGDRPAYEQQHWALQAAFRGLTHRAFTQIGGTNKRQQRKMVEAAFGALRRGQMTPGAKVLRKLIDDINGEAKAVGWQSNQVRENFVPEAFDHRAVEARRGEFEQMLVAAGVAQDEATASADNLINGMGFSEFALAPGQPVSTQQNASMLIEAVGADKLMKAGFLIENPTAILEHYTSGLAKRAAWEGTFGGTVSQFDNSEDPFIQSELEKLKQAGLAGRFSPNAGYLELLNKIEREHGKAARRETQQLVGGALGLNNLGSSSVWRNVQEWTVGLTNLMILGFSGIASIPELAIAPLRAQFGVGDIVGSLGNIKEARRFAMDMGIVMTTGAEQIMRESLGEGYRSSALRWANEQFFRLNGQQMITRASRTMATSVGMRYLLKAAADGDTAQLEKLHVTQAQVEAWNRAGRPAWSMDQSDGIREASRAVGQAVNQFVNESTLFPSKFQATGWGNNPYMKVIWHLKQFLYTYGDTVLAGTWRAMKERHGAAKRVGYGGGAAAVYGAGPAFLAVALMAPLAALSLGARDWFKDRDQERDGWELAGELFSKAGGLGPFEIVAGVKQAQEWDRSLVSAVVPAYGVGESLLNFGADGKLSETEARRKLRSMTPLLGQSDRAWNWLVQ